MMIINILFFSQLVNVHAAEVGCSFIECNDGDFIIFSCLFSPGYVLQSHAPYIIIVMHNYYTCS